MKTIHFKKSGQIKEVDEKNKVKISQLKEDGFVQVKFVKGEIIEVSEANTELEKAKKEIAELKKQLNKKA